MNGLTEEVFQNWCPCNYYVATTYLQQATTQSSLARLPMQASPLLNTAWWYRGWHDRQQRTITRSP